MKNKMNNKMTTNVSTYEELRKILTTNALRNQFGLMFVKLYPKDAQDIIENFSAKNRTLSAKNVRDYKKAMIEGKWNADVPETIAFDKKGEMFDGNHRLHALAECPDNVSITFNITIGCNKNAFTDINKHRTADDNLLCMGYVPKGKEEYFSKYILKAIGTIGNLQGIRSNVDSMFYMQDAIQNNTDVFIEFQKNFNVSEKASKEFRRIPILAATLNLFIMDMIDADDVAHIATVLHNVYSADFMRTSKDEPLLGLAKVSNEYSGGGEVIKKNLFVLATKAIMAYKKGNTKAKIQKPQERTTLELPQTYNMTVKKSNENIIVVEPKRKLA